MPQWWPVGWSVVGRRLPKRHTVAPDRAPTNPRRRAVGVGGCANHPSSHAFCQLATGVGGWVGVVVSGQRRPVKRQRVSLDKRHFTRQETLYSTRDTLLDKRHFSRRHFTQQTPLHSTRAISLVKTCHSLQSLKTSRVTTSNWDSRSQRWNTRRFSDYLQTDV